MADAVHTGRDTAQRGFRFTNLRSLRLLELSPELLQKLLVTLEEQKAGYQQRRAEIVACFETRLTQDERPDFKKYSREVEGMGYRIGRMDELIDKVTNARQRVVIHEGLARFWGRPVGIRRYDISMILLTVLAIAVLTYDLVFEPRGSELLWTLGIDAALCLVFIVDYFWRMALAGKGMRWHFTRHNWVDLLSAMPLILLVLVERSLACDGAWLLESGFLDTLANRDACMTAAEGSGAVRLLRVLRILRLLRAMRLLAFLWRGMERLERVMDTRLIRKSVFVTVILVILGGLVVNLGGEQSIKDLDPGLGNAIWFSVTTVTTGGLDIGEPQELLARSTSVLLILLGMVIIGALTATLTNIFIGESTDEQREGTEAMTEAIQQLRRELQELSQGMEDLERRVGSGSG